MNGRRAREQRRAELAAQVLRDWETARPPTPGELAAIDQSNAATLARSRVLEPLLGPATDVRGAEPRARLVALALQALQARVVMVCQHAMADIDAGRPVVAVLGARAVVCTRPTCALTQAVSRHGDDGRCDLCDEPVRAVTSTLSRRP